MDAGVDLGLANAWQRGFPLVPRPFAEIGARCGLNEAQVIERFARLRGAGVIDRVGPVFRPNTVGASLLAAMAVPEAELERVATLVSSHDGVNHNYQREHRFNLWFVLTGATPAKLLRTLARIESASGLAALRLPLIEEFHIDLGFDLATRAAPRRAGTAIARPLSAEEQRLVSAVARGLALVPRPYAALGVPELQAIGTLERWVRDGVVRRIGAVVRHRRVGYEANAMVAWDAPDERAGELGRRLAADTAVTLCYLRARARPQWPYNLYCMVHGRERRPVLDDVKRLCVQHGLAGLPLAVLFSRRCFTQKAAHYG